MAAPHPSLAPDVAGLALARSRLAEPARPRGSPWRALGAAALAALSAAGLCLAVFAGAAEAPIAGGAAAATSSQAAG